MTQKQWGSDHSASTDPAGVTDEPGEPGSTAGTGSAAGTGPTSGTGSTGRGGSHGVGVDGRTGTDKDGSRLERSRQHKVVAGVCGGLGRHFGVDPVIFRVPLAVLSVVGGLGLLFYAFTWLVMPLEGEDENEGRRLLSGRVDGSSLTAVLCALVGCGLALSTLNDSSVTTFSLMVATALGAAAYWSLNKRGGESEPGGEPRPEAPPEPMAPPTPVGPSWWREPAATEEYLWGPETYGSYGNEDKDLKPTGGSKPAKDSGEESCKSFSLGTGVFFTALGAGVLGSAAVWSSEPLSVALVVGLSAALGVFGLGLVLGAFTGRVGGGTIVSIVLTAVLIAGAAALPSDVTTSWSERTWRPVAADELQPSYRLGSGNGHLDLTRIELTEDETMETSLRVAAGAARVTLPSDVLVEVDVRVGVGGYNLSGLRLGGSEGAINGGGVRVSEKHTMVPVGEAAADPQGTVKLTVDLGIGGVNIERGVASATERR